jgi:hypothetical protein
MHWCLPLLKNGRKLVFLRFMNVDPQAPTWPFLIHLVTNRKGVPRWCSLADGGMMVLD